MIEKQKAEEREKTWATLEEGQVLTGIVRNVKPAWAFIDIGGVDAFLHISEMSWKRTEDAAELLKPGQSIKVAVTKLDKESRKVSVSLKQLEASPWDGIQQRFPVGSVIQGKVTRTVEFGAFVELEPGIEGLIHVSELDNRRVWRVNDIVKGKLPGLPPSRSSSIDPRKPAHLAVAEACAIAREAP